MTFQELQNQIRQLQQQAEAIRKEEASAVIAKLRATILEFGITPDEVFGASAKQIRRSPRGPLPRNTVIRYQGRHGVAAGEHLAGLWVVIATTSLSLGLNSPSIVHPPGIALTVSATISDPTPRLFGA